MSLHSWPLQQAVYSTLNGASLLDEAGNAIGGVYDDVPEGKVYPYVVIGEETQSNISTKSSDLHEHTLTIHVWSQYRGRKEIKVIMKQIYDSLHNNAITVTGASLVDIKQEFEQTLMESDGITRHGVMRFRAVVADA